MKKIGSADKQRRIDDIKKQSVAAGFSSTMRPVGGYASSPAFDPTHSSRDAIETGYNAAQRLIYGELISLDGAVASVHRLRDLL